MRWTEQGLEYEADPRQAEKLLRDLKVDEGVKSVGTPGVKTMREQLEGDVPLPYDKSSPYRAVVARANYLSADRPDLQYASKEVCRWMSTPAETALTALKRVGRYLEWHNRMVYRYDFQKATQIDCYSDTDRAGCPRTRRSTSGGA